MFYHRQLVYGSVLISTALIPFAATGQSHFSGEKEEQRASSDLNFNAPTYENPAISLNVDTMASTPNASERGATSFSKALARDIGSSLPAGISLMTSDADSSLVSINPAARPVENATPPAEPLDIDNEQSSELSNDVVREKAPAESSDSSSNKLVNKFIVHYPVALNNIPVAKFADVTAFVDATGKVETLRKRNLPTSLDSTTAQISADDALEAARNDAGNWSQNAVVGGPQQEVWVDTGNQGQLSYRIELTDNGSDPKARRYWVSAISGEVLYWENMMFHQHAGNVKGTIWNGPGTPTGATTSVPIPEMHVNRSGGGTALTNQLGNYSFPSGNGVRTMKGKLSGPHSVINNAAGSVLERSRNGNPSTAANLNFNASGVEQLAQTTAFVWTNKAHSIAADILDPTDLPNLPTIVNRPGQCNAFWNGSSINFFVAGGNCPNMAYDSVVLHEYGHGIDARKGGIIHGGYSEGFGDVMSVLGTRKSCVGRDFRGPSTCLRDAKDLIMWPPAGGVHQQGRVYAGFGWELTQQLKSVYAENTAFEIARQLIMGAAKANPSDIGDAVHLSFIIDDDDGDLTNGTPHFEQLAAAADSRNIPRPADPIRNVRRMGFAWANKPTTASYEPSKFYRFNSSGGKIKITRNGTGNYRVFFDGLGGHGQPGGNVQITGYGRSANDCKIAGWASSGGSFEAFVRCHKPNGALVDDRYTILVNWP